MNTKNNQRTRLSKILLKNALMDLLSEKGSVTKISVRELCERADLNRSTFYAHYSEPKELLEEVEAELLDATREHLQKIGAENDIGAHRYLLSFLIYIKENDQAVSYPAHRRGRPGVSLEIHAAVDNSIRREPQYLFSEGSGAVYLLLHLKRQHGRYNPVDALGLQHRRKRTCRPAVFHKSERSRKSCHKKEFMIENIVNRQYNTP